MFSSTYTSNPFQTFPSSSSSSTYPPLQFYIDPENAFASDTNTNTNILHDPSSLGVVPFMPSTQAPIPEPLTNLMVADYASLLQRDNANGNGAAQYGGGVSNFLTRKPAAKKDRHSKIFTSQGLRDRRVRLSSEIARKFFDLQDMLEYEKPSNTLEWLFTKSDNAIKELARSKHSCSGDAKCFCFCFSPELQGVGVDSNDKTFVGAGVANKEMKMKWVEKELDVGVQVQAKKESREKARARARSVRSSSKMCSTTSSLRVKDMEKRIPATADPRILHQLMPPIHPHTHLMVMGSEVRRDNGFEESIKEESGELKRDLKPSLIEIPVGTSFNNNDYDHYNSCPNSPQNWDINKAISGRSSFCAIASMNLSTELQILGSLGRSAPISVDTNNVFGFWNIRSE